MMHCKSKPPEDGPTDAVAAAFVTAGTAATGKHSKCRCHRRLCGREDRKTKNEGAELGREENEVERARAVRQHQERQAIDVHGCQASELECSSWIQNEAHSRASKGLRHDSGNAGGQRYEPNNLLQGDLDARRSILDDGCHYIIGVTPTPGHLSIRARDPIN